MIWRMIIFLHYSTMLLFYRNGDFEHIFSLAPSSYNIIGSTCLYVVLITSSHELSFNLKDSNLNDFSFKDLSTWSLYNFKRMRLLSNPYLNKFVIYLYGNNYSKMYAQDTYFLVSLCHLSNHFFHIYLQMRNTTVMESHFKLTSPNNYSTLSFFFIPPYFLSCDMISLKSTYITHKSCESWAKTCINSHILYLRWDLVHP